MTEQPREDVPAARCGAPLAGAAAPAYTAPADDTAAAAAPYERTRWEAEVLARQLHHRTVAVALVLSHHAGPGGILPEDGIQRTERMRRLVKIAPVSIRQELNALQGRGLLRRLPHSPGATRAAARGIALTIPVRREEPPHTGERP